MFALVVICLLHTCHLRLSPTIFNSNSRNLWIALTWEQQNITKLVTSPLITHISQGKPKHSVGYCFAFSKFLYLLYKSSLYYNYCFAPFGMPTLPLTMAASPPSLLQYVLLSWLSASSCWLPSWQQFFSITSAIVVAVADIIFFQL